MKATLEQEEIRAIAKETAQELLKTIGPIYIGKPDDETIFTIDELSKYLKVDPDWIYKRTHLKEIPYFKIGGFLRFRKKDIDRWIETCKIPAVNPISASFKRKNSTGRPED